MKKIIYVGLFNIEQMNAAGKRVFANAKLIKNCGHDVLLIGVNPESSEKTIRQSEKRIDGIRTFSFPGSVSKKDRYNVNKVFSIFKRFLIEEGIQSIESIIYYGSPSLAIFDEMLILYAHRNGIKIISDVVDWLSINTGNLAFDVLKKMDMYIEKAVINNSVDGAIVISSYLQQYYSKHIKNILVLPPLTWKKVDNMHVPNTKPIILYAGYPFRKNNKKGSYNSMKDRLDLVVDYLYYIMRRKVAFELHIYGITKEEYINCIPGDESKIRYMRDSVVFHGKVSMTDIDRILLKADYTILVRDVNRMTSAGFPTKIPESISSGVPVITTRTSDIEHYDIKNGMIFFLDGNDASRIKQLETVLNSSVETREMYKRVCCENNPFDYNLFKKEFDLFYKQIIS